MKEDKDDNASMNESLKLFYFFLFIAFILWVVWYFILKWLIPNIEHQGLTGDLFGGINALFTAFAFAGVIFTILLQRKELKYQRYELELTRNELKRSADAQTKTEMSLAKQTEAIDKTLKINVLNDLVKIVDAKLGVGQFTASELTDLRNKKEVYLSKLEEMLSDEIGKGIVMIYEIDLIKNKAKANLEAMKQMTESERRMFPPLNFIEDYNNIRKLALQANPSLEGIFPPEIKIAADIAHTDISYIVLQAYTDQIASLI